jgi:hypothetical protein
MTESYLAAVIWRLEHMTEADHRAAVEQAGLISRALRRRRTRSDAPRRPARIACEPS